MRPNLIFRWILLISLVVAATLGCTLVTRIREGIELVGTGRAFATDIGSFATEFIPPGINETAMAFVTQVEESGVLETAQAAITVNAPGLGETVQAVSTQVYTSPEDAPADIPLYEGEKSAFIGSPQSVSYFADAEFQDVVDFYKREMPANGWQLKGTEKVTGDTMFEAEYEKEDRSAVVVVTQVPFVGQTTVVISIGGS